MSDEVQAQIQEMIDNNPVVLFMKGNASMPQCGFSARTIEALDSLGVPYETVDVLSDPNIRQGIKDFSNWPTIPQLYVNKEFIGGCDIVTQMHGTGELHQLMGLEYVAPTAPEIHVTPAFVAAIEGAIAGAGGSGETRLQVSPRFEYGIGLSQEAPGDFKVEVGGLTILVDAATAPRADGIKLDFVDGPQGGILIDNPNEPPQVRRLDVQSYAAMRATEEEHTLLDVRTQEEWDIAHIDGAILMDEKGQKLLNELPEDTTIVVVCHHGIRSMQAAGMLLEKGFRKVFNLDGGIDAWSIQIDPELKRY